MLASLLRWGIPAVSLAALGYVLFLRLSPEELAETVEQSAPEWLLLGLLVFALTNLVRAGRIVCLLGWQSSRTLGLVPTMFASTLFKNVLPMRAGELSFPYLMRQHDVEWGHSLAILLVARLLDLLVVCVLFLVAAAPRMSLSSAPVKASVFVAVATSVVLLALLASLPLLGQSLGPATVRWLTHRGWLSANWRAKVSRQTEKGQEAVEILRDARICGTALFLSVLSWLATYAWFACFLRGIGMPMRFGQIVLGASFAVISKSLPVGSIAGFGAHEAGWTLGFTLIGEELSVAILSGFTVNLLTLFSSALFGLASLGWLASRSGRSLLSYVPGRAKE